MNVSENIYHSTRTFLMGGTEEKGTRVGAGFFASLEEMRRQLADPESRFYQETRETMARTLRENDERRKEEAVLDALMAIVDNMNGAAETETGLLGAKTGLELGLAQDGDPREPLTTEMLAFLATLGGRETFRVVEDEAERVRESGESRNADAAEDVLTEDRIASLAERYDPHHMSREAYDAFLDALVEEGELPQEATAEI